MKKYKLAINMFSIAILGTFSLTSYGSGFQLLEQNSSGLGNAFAGSTVNAENASIIYFNPAGMTYLPKRNLSFGITFIKPSFKFTNDGRSHEPAALGSVTPGNNGSDAGNWGVVPNAYLSWQLNDQWFAGLGIGAPFGLMTEYDDGWLGRFHSSKFDIKSININPSVAFKLNDQWSIGAGLNWQRLTAEYKLAQIVPTGITQKPYVEGQAKVNMDSNAWGWNIGAIFQPTQATSFGLSYRSKVKHSAEGTTELRGPVSVDFDANSTVKLPDTFIFSAMHQLNPQWTLLGDLSWTGWSSIQSLDIYNKGAPTNSLDLRFRDVWRVAVGTQFHYSDHWTFKGGVAIDQSPVRNGSIRPTAMPDSNRLWLSTGVQYRHNNSLVIDLGYIYLYVKDSNIYNGDPMTRGLVSGQYKNTGHVFGLQISKNF